MSKHGPPCEELLQACPYLRKWLHTCSSCGHVGYKPECPETGPVYRKLKRCFPLLELNRVGVCSVCELTAHHVEGSERVIRRLG
jgi:hypothetical protein